MEVLSSQAGLIALAFVALSALSIIFCRQLPRRIGGSLFAFGITIAAGIVVHHGGWIVADTIQRLCLLGAALTAVWTAASRSAGVGPSQQDGHSASSPKGAGVGESLSAWGLLTGAATAAGVLSLLMEATWPRIISPNASFESISWTGLLTMGLLLVSIGIWRLRGPSPQQPVTLLVVAALAVWWSSLMIPSASLIDEIPERLRLPLQPRWWTWTFQLQAGLSIVLVAAAIIQDLRYRGRRKAAWPDRLDDLLAPYPRWPGYAQVEGLLASAVLILGVYQVVRSGGRGWAMPTISAAACIASGIACLYMTYRRWSANTAGLGLALVTLSVVSLACAAASPFCPPSGYPTYADRMPILFNAILLALSLMIWLWGWLVRVWDQQLLDGIAWTTAGRMMPYAKRTAFYLAAIGLLVAFQMTLWRERALSSNDDNGPYRMIIGPLTMLLLSRQCASAARRGSIAWASFSVTALIAAIIFVFVRLPASDARGWVSQYGPVVLGAIAVMVLLVAESLPKSAWKAFAPPLWFLALLFIPMKALLDVLPGAKLPEEWVRPVALGILAILYFIAGTREHRRAFLILGTVLLAAAANGAYRL